MLASRHDVDDVQVASTSTLGNGLPVSGGACTALLLACNEGHTDIVEELFKQYFPQRCCKSLENPNSQALRLQVATTSTLGNGLPQRSSSVFTFLVASRHDVDDVQVASTSTMGNGLPVSSGAWTALLLACDEGHTDIVEELLKQRITQSDLTAVFEATSAEVSFNTAHSGTTRC